MKTTEAQRFFYIGKGGVGKSTLSALNAVCAADNGKETLLVSMDPAHNQRDIFQQSFNDRPQVVCPHLRVVEIDIREGIRHYLSQTTQQLKQAYHYQNALNLTRHFNVMQHAPGLEEHALLLAFRRIVKNENKIAGIYFDMPPTAMTLRFLSLPKLSQTWLNELLRLRGHIKEKREIISRIKFGKRELEEDPVITRLKQMIRDQQSLQQLLQTSDSHFRIVSSPDCVSLSETMRIRERFSEMEYTVESLILNRSSTHQPEALPDELSGIPRHTVPQADYPLIGLPALRRFIAETGE